MGRTTHLRAGAIGFAVHRNTRADDRTHTVPIYGSVLCKTKTIGVTLPTGQVISRVVPHENQPKAYRGNGAREKARRARQMEAR